MKIAFTTITVDKLERSLEFYKNIIGLSEIRRINPQEGIQCIFLKDEEGSVIELIEDKTISNANVENREHRVSIGFNVDNLDDTIKVLEDNSIEIISGPIEVPGGVKFIFIKDPSGVSIELIEGFKK